MYKKLAFSTSDLYALNTEKMILIYGKETFSHFFKLFFVFEKKEQNVSINTYTILTKYLHLYLQKRAKKEQRF